MQSKLTVPIAIVAGGLVIAMAVYVTTPKRAPSMGGNPALVRPVDASDHVFGNPNAPVKIVEYSDFDCDYCQGFDSTMREIIGSSGTKGRVAWVYREFPLTELHPNALSSAEAAECAALAGGSDAFWKFTDILFKNQPVDPTQYGTYAKNAGVTSEAFATCFMNASTTVFSRIMADRTNAFAVGAEGTPYSLIVVDGKAPVVMSGAYDYEEVKQLIDDTLAGLAR